MPSEVSSLASSEKSSIAVLPFTNMSGEPEQEYFSDGITEDVITELSRFSELRVIARNSSFFYKGKTPKIQEVGRGLGARYVIEGSVRKAGNRVRVTAKLIEAETGSQLWGERFDRILEDIFDLQDELVRAIVGKIPEQIERIAVRWARKKVPANMTAFDYLLRGRWALHHTGDGLALAIQYLEESLKADPDYASAHALMSYAYSYGIYVLGHNPDDVRARSQWHAARAVELDATNAEVNAAAAICYILCGDHERADAHSERAVFANPNDNLALYSRGLVLAYVGRAQEALEFFETMQSIDPLAPDDVRADGLSDCLFMLGRYEDMLTIYRRWQGELPAFLLLVQAAAQSRLGDYRDARESVEEYRSRGGPKPDAETFVAAHVRMMKREQDRANWLEGYRGAGLSV
jgi:TolB-like protein/Tfp pilus assembly protein PilF